MAQLVVDGRIHPARIEKLVEDAHAEVENTIREEGERAAYETGVHGLHPEILNCWDGSNSAQAMGKISILMRLKPRTSRG
jgi:hypothetical protein